MEDKWEGFEFTNSNADALYKNFKIQVNDVGSVAVAGITRQSVRAVIKSLHKSLMDEVDYNVPPEESVELLASLVHHANQTLTELLAILEAACYDSDHSIEELEMPTPKEVSYILDGMLGGDVEVAVAVLAFKVYFEASNEMFEQFRKIKAREDKENDSKFDDIINNFSVLEEE